MLKYGATGAALLLLAGCAGLAPAGRNASRAPEAAAPPAAAAPTTTPAPVVTQPAPVAAPEPAQVEAAAPSAPANDDDIVVQGQARAQAIAPDGDPRSVDERRADVRAWDQCVMQVQNAFDSDPMRPQLTTPEEYCANSLGMSDRNALPIGRRRP
jgi:hypothetical protein